MGSCSISFGLALAGWLRTKRGRSNTVAHRRNIAAPRRPVQSADRYPFGLFAHRCIPMAGTFDPAAKYVAKV